MAIVTRMQDVTLSIDGRKIGLCRKAEIHREYETIEYPIYRDSSAVRTLRTLEKIRVILEKVYQEKEDFLDNLSETDLEFSLSTGEETHTVSGGQIIFYNLADGSTGYLLERVVLNCESFS